MFLVNEPKPFKISEFIRQMGIYYMQLLRNTGLHLCVYSCLNYFLCLILFTSPEFNRDISVMICTTVMLIRFKLYKLQLFDFILKRENLNLNNTATATTVHTVMVKGFNSDANIAFCKLCCFSSFYMFERQHTKPKKSIPLLPHFLTT